MTELMRRRRALMAAQGGGETENFVKIGSPNISNKILYTGENGFIRTPSIFNPGSSPWKIRCGFTWYSGTGNRDFFGSCSSDGASQRGVLLEGVGTTKLFVASSGQSTWNIINGALSQTTTTNQPYVYEVEFTGTQYRTRISSDGGSTFNEWVTRESSSYISGSYYLSFGLKRNQYLYGEINLAQCAVWINDVLWWEPYK